MTEAYVVDTSALMQAYIEDEFTPHMEHLLTGLGEDNSLETIFFSKTLYFPEDSY